MKVNPFSTASQISNSLLDAATFCMLAARLSLTIPTSNVVGFAVPLEGSPTLSFSKEFTLMLSNCFGRPIYSLKDLSEVRSDSALMEGLSLPFKAVLQSQDIVFAENDKSFRTKFSSSFGGIPLNFLSLPVFTSCISRGGGEPAPVLIGANGQSETKAPAPAPVLIGANGQSDTNRASRGPSTGSADVIDSKDELANGFMNGCVTGEYVIRTSTGNTVIRPRFASKEEEESFFADCINPCYLSDDD